MFVPTDKASNNISIVCKEFYIKTMLKELKVFDSEIDSNTYENITLTPDKIVEEHREKCKEWKIDLDDMQQCLQCIHRILKMHKNPSK